MNSRRCGQGPFDGWHSQWTVLLAFLACAVVCWSQQTTPKETPTEIRELVDGGSKYGNRLITVRGCFVKEFEIRVVQPCDTKFDQFSKYVIWMDDIDGVTNRGKSDKGSFIPADSAKVLKDGRGDLWKLGAPRTNPAAVILQGEFQTGRERKYGHLNFYRQRFIVHRLLWHAERASHP